MCSRRLRASSKISQNHLAWAWTIWKPSPNPTSHCVSNDRRNLSKTRSRKLGQAHCKIDHAQAPVVGAQGWRKGFAQAGIMMNNVHSALMEVLNTALECSRFFLPRPKHFQTSAREHRWSSMCLPDLSTIIWDWLGHDALHIAPPFQVVLVVIHKLGLLIFPLSFE